MILNLGNNTAIPIESVIFIFNAQNVYNSKNNMSFLNSLTERSNVVYIDKSKETKSIIYAVHNNTRYIYYSIINPTTLQKRGNNFAFSNLTEDI